MKLALPVYPTKRLLIIFFTVVFILYCLFQARFLILGPQVKITSHGNGEVVGGKVLVLEGTAKNAAWISLNGRQIYTDENGIWSEKLVVSRGISIMTIEAEDRFGRVASKNLEIMLN